MLTIGTRIKKILKIAPLSMQWTSRTHVLIDCLLVVYVLCLHVGARAHGEAETDPGGQFDVAASQFVARLHSIFGCRVLTGYGGRKFRIEFREKPKWHYVSGKESGPESKGVICIPHWQVQKDAAMKYLLCCVIVREQGRFRLKDVTLRFLGEHEGSIFRGAKGYRDMPVLTNRSRYNVYRKPVIRAFQHAF